MSQYKDYGFDSADESHVHQYLTEPVLRLLGPPSGKNSGCGLWKRLAGGFTP